MEKSRSFIKEEFRPLTLQEIKNNFDSMGPAWLDHVNTNSECIKREHVENFIEEGMKDSMDLSQMLVTVCSSQPSPVNSFEVFVIASVSVFNRQLWNDYKYSTEFFKFIDPILSGELRFGNHTAIAMVFGGVDGKYLTKERMGWLNDLDFYSLSEIIDALLGTGLLDPNYVKIAVSKCTNLDFKVILQLRSLLKESFRNTTVTPQNSKEIDRCSVVLKLLCDVGDLSKLSFDI